MIDLKFLHLIDLLTELTYNKILKWSANQKESHDILAKDPYFYRHLEAVNKTDDILIEIKYFTDGEYNDPNPPFSSDVIRLRVGQEELLVFKDDTDWRVALTLFEVIRRSVTTDGTFKPLTDKLEFLKEHSK